MPHKFTDNESREWSLRLTLATDGDVHREIGHHLSDLQPEPTVDLLAKDATLLAGALWALVEKSATERGVSRGAFLDAIGGESFEAAYEAVVEETLDFLGSRGRTLRAIRQAVKSKGETQTAELLQRLAGLDASTALDGSVALSVESTPETSDSAS